MKRIRLTGVFALTIFLLILISASGRAQEKPIRADKMYFRSGFGFTIPVGESNDYLTTKFSTSLGVLYALGDGPLFLYPKLNLHAFGFNQLATDPDNKTLAKVGRATTYLLNMALGYRKSVGRVGFYGFMGGGGGVILTPRIVYNAETNTATQHNALRGMPIMETGGGIDYSFGNTQLFAEATYLRGFRKVEDQTFHSVPVNIGVKTNISRIFFK